MLCDERDCVLYGLGHLAVRDLRICKKRVVRIDICGLAVKGQAMRGYAVGLCPCVCLCMVGVALRGLA